MIFKKQSSKPVIIGILAFALFSFLTYQYIEFDNGLREKNERSKLLELLILKKSKVEKALSSRIYYTKGVAAYVSLNPDINNTEYQNLAKELINQDTVISTMALSKNAVISSIYPEKGHEEAIGLNLLDHPERKKIVEKTIETKNTFVAGPVELVEGGIAFISYTPIFNKLSKDTNSFWGMTDIVIKRDAMLNEAELFEKDDENYYALKGIDGKGIEGDIFWGHSDVFNNDPVTIKITLPTGNWILASVPVNGWNVFENKSFVTNIILFAASLIISVLVWLLSNAWIKIKNKESELSALFGAMNDLVIIMDDKGYYRSIAPTNNHLLIRPASELLNKSVYDFFDHDAAKYFHDSIKKAIENKSTILIDYPLEINGKELWFEARLSYVSKNSVIYVAHDNTEKKLAELKLIQSEKELKESNAMKDKFFSILAHDLKNPIGSFMNLTDMIFQNYSNIDENEKFELIEYLKDSSHSLYSLLENLLEWSRVQRGAIKPEYTKVDINFLITNTIEHLNTMAKDKKIDIKNNIDKNIIAFCDSNMIQTVFRNIIINAVKFTEDEGDIIISSNIEEIEKNKFIVISIKDSGIGIEKERINKLFKIDSAVSTPGTNNEKGTGLGLILCKEFVEINKGFIKVDSELGKGTKFSIYIPSM